MSQHPFSSPYYGQPGPQGAYGYHLPSEQPQAQYQVQQAAPSHGNPYILDETATQAQLHNGTSFAPAHFTHQTPSRVSQSSPMAYDPTRTSSASHLPFSPVQPVPERPTMISSVIADEMEEGELSDGPDGYDPRESFIMHEDFRQTRVPPTQPYQQSQPVPNQTSRNRGTSFVPVSAPKSRSSRSTSVLEAQATDFYEEEEEGEVIESWPSDNMASKRQNGARERSASYSPYLSAGEVQEDNTPQKYPLAAQSKYERLCYTVACINNLTFCNRRTTSTVAQQSLLTVPSPRPFKRCSFFERKC
jgi:hypothetical protein